MPVDSRKTSAVRCAANPWVVVAQTLLTALALTACTSISAPTEEAVVVHNIIDGDTVLLRFPGGQQETVRLLGIDTPETVDPTRPVQCFGPEASTFLTELLPPGTPVDLERDVAAHDRFGRLLAYVFRSSDGLFVNVEMLRSGFADVSIFAPNTAYQEALTNAATEARTGSIGLWGACGGPDVALDPEEYEHGTG